MAGPPIQSYSWSNYADAIPFDHDFTAHLTGQVFPSRHRLPVANTPVLHPPGPELITQRERLRAIDALILHAEKTALELEDECRRRPSVDESDYLRQQRTDLAALISPFAPVPRISEDDRLAPLISQTEGVLALLSEADNSPPLLDVLVGDLGPLIQNKTTFS
jgi:hypothetical protein